MAEKDPNLEWNLDVSDLSSISLDDESLENLDIDGVLENPESVGDSSSSENLNSQTLDVWSSTIDESVFLDTWNITQPRINVVKDQDNFWFYLRCFFFSAVLTLLWLLAIILFYSFRFYIKEATKPNPDPTNQEYVEKYKENYRKVKDMLWIYKTYAKPVVWEDNEEQKVNEIVGATEIDYIDKKDLLSEYVSNLVKNVEDAATYSENLKQDIAKQWYLPEELEILLSEDQAIDTIQRSLNALEVIKFSTATKVFSYMNTALSTILEMIRVSWVTVDNLHDLFEKLSSRWDKDISSYVYMCYLNPFEVNANCDTVWDFDLYYKLAKDDSIDIKLFKNSMNAINQLLEKWEFSLFSITFNWFNAADKNIQFNVEVYTTQEDEKVLMKQWKRNPNIFILSNIINLLKQSSFIIGAEINTKEINVDTRTMTQWWISRPVNYSTMDFSVPIQKNMEREIFDYIDLISMKKLLLDRWFNDNLEDENDSLSSDNNEIDEWELEEEGVNSEDLNPEENDENDESEIGESESEETEIKEVENDKSEDLEE